MKTEPERAGMVRHSIPFAVHDPDKEQPRTQRWHKAVFQEVLRQQARRKPGTYRLAVWHEATCPFNDGDDCRCKFEIGEVR